MTWTCPHCGSNDLSVYFSERRHAPIDQTIAIEPTPDVNQDDFCDGPFDLNVICNACGESNITPTKTIHATKE